ncbi:hypothetical protein FRB93_006185 [Tulasnella sp. JGI-2019a]|nr:hypothetical protein FRB93_006185 [Tulasnella sp. JGI-2019a]
MPRNATTSKTRAFCYGRVVESYPLNTDDEDKVLVDVGARKARGTLSMAAEEDSNDDVATRVITPTAPAESSKMAAARSKSKAKKTTATTTTEQTRMVVAVKESKKKGIIKAKMKTVTQNDNNLGSAGVLHTLRSRKVLEPTRGNGEAAIVSGKGKGEGVFALK